MERTITRVPNRLTMRQAVTMNESLWNHRRHWRAVSVLLILAFASTVQAQNAISNGDFDTDISGWAAASGSLSHDADEGSTSGPGSLMIFTTSNSSRARQCVTNALPSTPYSFGADFRVEAGGLLNFCRIQLEEYDTGNCAGVSNIQTLEQQLFVQPSAVYTSLNSGLFTAATTNAIRVDLFCDENGTNHTVNWDDVYLVPEVESVQYTLLTGFSDALYHMPGDNGLIADLDDLISAEPTSIVGSDPNYRGAYSYRTGQIFNTPAEPGLADAHNRITYLEGTVDVVPGGGFVDSNLMRTGQRQGFGLRPWNGPVGRDYLSGDILTFDAPFTTTGIAYVDDVLIPKAQELGADGLLFADLSGVRPPNGNHPNGLPERHVYVGVKGVTVRSVNAAGTTQTSIGSNTADLSVSKSVNVTGLQAPGTSLVYTLDVSNAGPGDATGVILRDRLSSDVDYLSNTCGGADPVNGLFSWNIGNVMAAGTVSCQISVQVQLDTVFDVHNAAIVFGDQWDPSISNNTSEITVEILDMAGPGISQAPDQSTGFQSDLSCNACGSGNQAIADAFKVDTAIDVCGLTFHGGYTDNIPFDDLFQILIYDNNRATPGLPGVPGSLIATLDGGFMSRIATGQQIIGGLDEYRYSFVTLGPAATLGRGKYWLVIVNDSSSSRGGSGDWFWESGSPDAMGNSIPGLVFNPGFANASAGWGPNPQLETAFELCANTTIPPVPEIFEDGFEQ